MGDMMAESSLQQRISMYKNHVQYIPDDHNGETDVLLALIDRSAFQDRWDELTPAQQAEVQPHRRRTCGESGAGHRPGIGQAVAG
jgi:hypothetical protein